MLEYNKLTVLEMQLSDIAEYLPKNEDLDWVTEAADKELDYIDQSQIHCLAVFTVEELKRDCPLVFTVLDEVTKLMYIDKIHIWC